MFETKKQQNELDGQKIRQLIRENNELIEKFQEQNRKIDELLRRIETFEFNRL